jgi:hypothetical protein
MLIVLLAISQATLRMQSNSASLHQILIELDFLRPCYSKVIEKYPDSPAIHIVRAARLGQTMIDKYRDTFRKIPVCIAVVVRHPAFKWEYFQTVVYCGQWTKDVLSEARRVVKDLWANHYCSSTSRPGTRIEHPDITVSNQFDAWRARKQHDALGIHLSSRSIPVSPSYKTNTDSIVDELERYETTPADPSIVDA